MANTNLTRYNPFQDTLTLKWQTHLNVPQNATVHWNGFPAGQFQQTFTLPSAINSERAEADYTNGVLTLKFAQGRAREGSHCQGNGEKVEAKSLLRQNSLFGHPVFHSSCCMKLRPCAKFPMYWPL